MKRGFKTKSEALPWERAFLQKQSADKNMSFKDFVDIYFANKQNRLKEQSIKKYMIEAKV